MSERDEMELPEGKTCLRCASFWRCTWIIRRQGSETSCDWSPSRFVDVLAKSSALLAVMALAGCPSSSRDSRRPRSRVSVIEHARVLDDGQVVDSDGQVWTR